MTPSPDKERKAFEEWAKRNGLSTLLPKEGVSSFHFEHALYPAFKGGMQAAQAEMMEDIKVLKTALLLAAKYVPNHPGQAGQTNLENQIISQVLTRVSEKYGDRR